MNKYLNSIASNSTNMKLGGLREIHADLMSLLQIRIPNIKAESMFSFLNHTLLSHIFTTMKTLVAVFALVATTQVRNRFLHYS